MTDDDGGMQYFAQQGQAAMFDNHINSAAMAVSRSLDMLREAQAGTQDADLFACTMNEVERALNNAANDLKAVAALH